MTDVVIIGGGHVGTTLLADLTATRDHHGQSARLLLYRPRREEFSAAVARRAGRYRLHEKLSGRKQEVLLSESLFAAFRGEEAVRLLEEAGIVFVTVPDIPALRLELIRELTSSVDLNDKITVFIRAGQGGQPVLADMVHREEGLARAHVLLVEDSFYGTRVMKGLISYKRKFAVNVSVYSYKMADVLRRVRAIFPLGHIVGQPSWPDLFVVPGIDLLFCPLGYIIHTGVTLWPRNLAMTEKGVRYSHYIDGIDRALAARLDSLDKERVRLAAAYGVKADLFSAILCRQYGVPETAGFYEMMQNCRGIYDSLSPSSLDDLRSSRYILEDIPALYTIQWLARRAGLDLPATDAHATAVGRTLDLLGVDRRPLEAYGRPLSQIPGDPAQLGRLLSAPRVRAGQLSRVGTAAP